MHFSSVFHLSEELTKQLPPLLESVESQYNVHPPGPVYVNTLFSSVTNHNGYSRFVKATLQTAPPALRSCLSL